MCMHSYHQYTQTAHVQYTYTGNLLCFWELCFVSLVLWFSLEDHLVSPQHLSLWDDLHSHVNKNTHIHTCNTGKMCMKCTLNALQWRSCTCNYFIDLWSAFVIGSGVARGGPSRARPDQLCCSKTRPCKQMIWFFNTQRDINFNRKQQK